MIRDRLDQDLAPLVRVLDELQWPSATCSAGDRRAWLVQPSAQIAWVFDAAPVSVTPTRNVQGHVQIGTPGESEELFLAPTGVPAGELLVIGRLFVRPGPYAEGIRRFLLTEAVRNVRTSGRAAVLDVAANPGLSENLCHRRGFRRLPTGGPGPALMIHDEEAAGERR